MNTSPRPLSLKWLPNGHKTKPQQTKPNSIANHWNYSISVGAEELLRTKPFKRNDTILTTQMSNMRHINALLRFRQLCTFALVGPGAQHTPPWLRTGWDRCSDTENICEGRGRTFSQILTKIHGLDTDTISCTTLHWPTNRMLNAYPLTLLPQMWQ